MAQVSYGTITINDLTDITDLYLQYGLALADATVTNSYPFNRTGEIGWSTTYPTWQSGYQIWKRQVTIKEGIDEPEYGTPYLDTAVNQINTNVINLSNKLTNFFYPGDSSYSGAFATGKSTSEGLNPNNANTYGWNTRIATAVVSMGYNKIPLVELGLLDGGSFNGLKLYSPIITNDVVTGNRLDATLSTDGLVLSKGGIISGTSPTSTDFIYLSTTDYSGSPTITINGNNSGWRQIIGNKFGVKNDGTLYASNVNVEGTITVGAGSNVYTNDEIDSQTTATEERFNSQDSQLSILGERTEELDSNYDSLVSDVNLLKPLNDYVSIQNNPARIDLVAGDNRLSLTTSEIQILIDNQLSSWFSGNTVFNKKIIAGEIYPRYITGNVDTKPSLTGGFGWIARSNGNLSLKIIRIGE